ncbi:hypothetical protein RAMLITH_00830 [Ramlibacter sp. RBP-2]|uniref:Uncharacterized protein n=1 Tax=Ramlibacter lithotrophicus TaxID=2606681 RepID=A0A7X6DBX5_9BURK|nr:hypothetical protein [Ramlibacter lithotrophicus]NKE64350.1 hypothetical protein [Ramlibacter lithotrophicus]
MKAVLPALLAAAAAWPAAAEAPAAERARIAADRSRVEAQYQDQERACWARFGVNDCLAEARAKRRSALADLRRQEIALNDAERKQRAAERLRSMEQSQGQAAPGSSPPKVRDGGERDAKAAQRAAEQAARQAEHARRTRGKRQADSAVQVDEELARREAQRASRAERAAENVRRRETLQREARERQEALQRRLDARQKAPAAPLPVPP